MESARSSASTDVSGTTIIIQHMTVNKKDRTALSPFLPPEVIRYMKGGGGSPLDEDQKFLEDRDSQVPSWYADNRESNWISAETEAVKRLTRSQGGAVWDEALGNPLSTHILFAVRPQTQEEVEFALKEKAEFLEAHEALEEKRRVQEEERKRGSKTGSSRQDWTVWNFEDKELDRSRYVGIIVFVRSRHVKGSKGDSMEADIIRHTTKKKGEVKDSLPEGPLYFGIRWLGVESKYGRQGIGKRLLYAMEAFARSFKPTHAVPGTQQRPITVQAIHAPAISFESRKLFGHFGYSVNKNWKNTFSKPVAQETSPSEWAGIAAPWWQNKDLHMGLVKGAMDPVQWNSFVSSEPEDRKLLLQATKALVIKTYDPDLHYRGWATLISASCERDASTTDMRKTTFTSELKLVIVEMEDGGSTAGGGKKGNGESTNQSHDPEEVIALLCVEDAAGGNLPFVAVNELYKGQRLGQFLCFVALEWLRSTPGAARELSLTPLTKELVQYYHALGFILRRTIPQVNIHKFGDAQLSMTRHVPTESHLFELAAPLWDDKQKEDLAKTGRPVLARGQGGLATTCCVKLAPVTFPLRKTVVKDGDELVPRTPPRASTKADIKRFDKLAQLEAESSRFGRSADDASVYPRGVVVSIDPHALTECCAAWKGRHSSISTGSAEGSTKVNSPTTAAFPQSSKQALTQADAIKMGYFCHGCREVILAPRTAELLGVPQQPNRTVGSPLWRHGFTCTYPTAMHRWVANRPKNKTKKVDEESPAKIEQNGQRRKRNR